MKHTKLTSALGLLFAAAWLAGCSGEQLGYAEYEGDEAETESSYGSAEQAVNACVGDDMQYDFNAFAASLAVAIGNEIGRWDVTSDFELRSGKLELSSTGEARCGATGCQNVRAILRLQDDASSTVPNHSPSVFRSKLATWYDAEKLTLTEIASAARLKNGTYRLVNRGNAKRLAVAGGSTAEGAAVQMFANAPATGADQWTSQVSGSGYRFINVKSGKCLDMQSDSSADGVVMVQKTCSSSATQVIKLGIVDPGYAALTTKHNKVLEVKNYSSVDGTPVQQSPVNVNHSYKAWKIENTSGVAVVDQGLSNGMYTLTSKHTGKLMGVENAALTDNALVKQYTSAVHDKFHWFIYKVGSKYQIINRRSGKCLALLTDTSTSEALGQKTCANVSAQQFSFERVAAPGERRFNIRGPYNKLLEVSNALTADGTPLVLRTGDPQNHHRVFLLDDIMAGEPHKLTYTHSTNDGPCGDYKWYNITQPNGLALVAPENSYANLIFAGGKRTLNGADENPFIAQVVGGVQLAIDPSGTMLPGSASSSGSCLSIDLLYDPTKLAAGKCCQKSTGAQGAFAVSSWSTTTFLCK